MSDNQEFDLFVDTNILVYAYDRSAGDKHAIACKLMESLWEAQNGCLSIQVLQEFYISVTRKIVNPLGHDTARQIIYDLSHWRIHIPETDDLLNAIDIQQLFRVSFWDAMIIQSAAQLGCRQLLSEDLSHGQAYGDVQVVDPFKETD